jgi:CubicO group peptidase (beta-lactamase class C family)
MKRRFDHPSFPVSRCFMVRYPIVVAGLLFCWPFLAAAQDGKPLPVLTGVTEAMNALVEKQEVPGVVTFVATEKGIMHWQATGKADLEGDKIMSKDAIFWIASMSKPVTGLAVMILVDEGKISLDDPIDKHLPEMKSLAMADGKPTTITLRHILTHTSGMSELKDAYSCKTLAEAAEKYAKLPVQFEPGSKWQYSQTGINTAARIVEVVSGKTFDQFLEERLFQPLGMKDTTFYLNADQLPRLAKSYRKQPSGKFEPVPIFLLSGKSPDSRDRFPAANGGLFSTANDYGRFCRMLLGEGELDGKRILSAKGVETFRTVQSGDVKTGFTPGNAWGVGCCIVREPQGVTATLSPGTFGHGGAYGTQAWIDPVKKRVFVLMIQRSNLPNADGSDIRSAFQQAAVASLEGK